LTTGAFDGAKLERFMSLRKTSSLVFTARAMSARGAIDEDMEKVRAAFKGDGALAWRDHHPCLFVGTERFFRTGYRAYLPTEGSRRSMASRTGSGQVRGWPISAAVGQV
jgi:hypothetical protein